MAFSRTAYEFLRGSEKGSFAEKTMSERVPGIGRRTLEDNKSRLDADSIEDIKKLIDDLPNGRIRKIEHNKAAKASDEPDVDDWNEHLTPYLGQTWLEAPWFVAEAYFYRRLVEVTRPFGVDVFQKEKKDSLEGSSNALGRLSLLPNTSLSDLNETKATFINLIFRALWANRADLSLWKPGDAMLQAATATSLHDEDAKETEELKSKVLVDDSIAAWNFIYSTFESKKQGLDLGVIVDNCGIEIIADMRLADFFLETGLAKSVTFHLKYYPLFVSDAMPKDVLETLNFIIDTANDNAKEQKEFGRRLKKRLDEGSWILENDPFWNSAKLFEELPQGLRGRLQNHDLIVSKGDANYRRLAGERRYPHTLPFKTVAVGALESDGVPSYFPTPVLALRTCKADIVVGISQEMVERVSSEDPDWLVNGRWGVIQFATAN